MQTVAEIRNLALEHGIIKVDDITGRTKVTEDPDFLVNRLFDIFMSLATRKEKKNAEPRNAP